MRFTVFTPAIKASAIGRMACLVGRALVERGHEVTVVRSEDVELLTAATHEFGVELVAWNDRKSVNALVENSDQLVYHVGDNYLLHRGCLEWLPDHPGAVCLHDYFVGHLFYAWAQAHSQEARAVAESWYGPESAQRFFGHPDSETLIATEHDRAPMTEWISAMATGVITHSSWAIERVLKACPGPVYTVPLAYDAPGADSAAAEQTKSEDCEFKILTIGHVNPNKRVESVIRAVGQSPDLRRVAHYRLTGRIQPETASSLAALAEAQGVTLTISGEVDDATLIQAIGEADVVSCLRWPCLESASASAIEAMLYGKPAIVIDAGFYREIPGGLVLKIEPENEIEGIREALERSAADPVARRAMGARASEWALRTFTAGNYADRLLDMAGDLPKFQPWNAAIDFHSGTLFRWAGRSAAVSPELVADIADPLQPLVGAPPSPDEGPRSS